MYIGNEQGKEENIQADDKKIPYRPVT